MQFIVLYFRNSVREAERQPRDRGASVVGGGLCLCFLGLCDEIYTDTLGNPACVEEERLEIRDDDLGFNCSLKNVLPSPWWF